MKNKIINLQKAPRGFCLAKWYQVTIDLTTGYTHSCHHPDKHKIPLEELLANPMALHNTKFKMLQRKKMLEGERPEECSYCWNIEDISNDLVSDRLIKSTDDWAFDKLESTLKLPWDSLVAPTYLEVLLSTDCNLSCTYCVADLSTSIKREMEKFGPYPVKSNQRRIPTYQENKEDKKIYLEAFWKFLNMVSPELRVFRITGGEPLLSEDTFRILEFFEANPNPSLELAINTNLSYSPERCAKLLAFVKCLLAKRCIKNFSFYISIDSFGDRAEYIRKGLSSRKFLENYAQINSALPGVKIVIMCTYNIFSVFNFLDLLSWIEEQKKTKVNLHLDICYLTKPEYLMANIIDKNNLHYLNTSLEKLKNSTFFSEYEIQKFERVKTWIEMSVDNPKRSQYRSDFYSFVNEFDQRYETRFLEIFPEASSFYQLCRKSYIMENLKNNEN